MVLKSSGAGGWRRSEERNGRNRRERRWDAWHRGQGSWHGGHAWKWRQSSGGQCWLGGGQCRYRYCWYCGKGWYSCRYWYCWYCGNGWYGWHSCLQQMTSSEAQIGG
ncbi:hypothetical protein BT93_G1437 [Corymbia citriodora subsp. variegata]|nr:hypothetical protein BT93_G1437 [Corymbia citriodora subsp. variegata]